MEKSGTKYVFGEHEDVGLISEEPPDYFKWEVVRDVNVDHRGHYTFKNSENNKQFNQFECVSGFFENDSSFNFFFRFNKIISLCLWLLKIPIVLSKS